MNKIILTAIAVLFLGGCSMKDVQKAPQLYELSSQNSCSNSTQSIAGVLKVAKTKSSEYLYSDALWYKEPSNEVYAYVYSRWNGNFVHMIEKNIADCLFQSGLFKSVFRQNSKLIEDVILESEVIQAYHDTQSNSVFFTIRLYLVEKASKEFLGSKEFSYKQKCESFDAKGAVFAYEKIIENFHQEMIEWIGNIYDK